MEEAVGIEKGHEGYASHNFNEIGVGLGKMVHDTYLILICCSDASLDTRFTLWPETGWILAKMRIAGMFSKQPVS